MKPKKNNLFISKIPVFLMWIVFGFFVVMLPMGARALELQTQVQVPGGSKNITIDGNSIAEYLSAWYRFAIAAIGILAMTMAMGGGLIWLTAGGSSSQISKAKEWIMGAIVGMILALMSYSLLWMLNPNLVTFETLTIPDVKIVVAGKGNCCYPSSGPSTEIDVNGVCAKRDKNGKVLEQGNVCDSGMMQACLPEAGSSGEKIFSCKVVDKDTPCSDTNGCPTGWFCVNQKCNMGVYGDSCSADFKSCKSGFRCVKGICSDGRKDAKCDLADPSSCKLPLTCVTIPGGHYSLTEYKCGYNASDGEHCIPCNSACNDASEVIDATECCVCPGKSSGDCQWDFSGKFRSCQ